MLRTILFVLLFASPVFAQDAAISALATAAGCGTNDVKFEVKTDKNKHPTGQPETGKALVYVIGGAWSDGVAVHIGTPPNRFGVDGNWVGANGYRSYFFFQVDPGDHRLCTNMQSMLKNAVKSSMAAISFTAEPGQIYYFRTKTPRGSENTNVQRLEPVDPAEAQVFLASTSFSTFHQKN